MIVRNTEKVDASKVEEGGANGVSIRVMLGEPEGVPNFILRHFTIEPGGNSPRHAHEWEHEVYVLKGAGTVFGNGEEQPIGPGDSILVPPNEEHQFKAADDTVLEFLCIIPKM